MNSSRAKTPSRLLMTVAFTISALLLGIIGAVAAGTGTVTPPPKIAFVTTNANVAPDALTVGPMAGRLGAPLFITNKDALGESTKDGLIDYGADLIIVAAGPNTVTDAVLAQIAAATGKTIAPPNTAPASGIVRVFGDGRDQTAVALSTLIAKYNPKFLPTDATAADADLLDGKDSTAFLGATAKAADADKLDGMNSSAFFAVEGGFAPQTVHVSNGPDTTSAVIELTKLSINPGDPCGAGTTDHTYLATFTGTARFTGAVDSSHFVGARIVKDGETMNANSFASGDGTTSVKGLQTSAGFDFSSLNATRLFTDIPPGAQDIRVLFQELDGESDDSIWNTLSLAYLGYSCP